MRWMKKEREQESVSLTLLIFLTIIITLKLLVSGMTISGYTFSEFTAMDWTTIFVPVAGLYFGRKLRSHKDLHHEEPSETCPSEGGKKESKGPR
jgi:hypothetical protein